MQARIVIRVDRIPVARDNRLKGMEALVELIIRIITHQELSISVKKGKPPNRISISVHHLLVMREATPQPLAEEAISLIRITSIVANLPQATYKPLKTRPTQS
jgi:hypothetical protein